MRCQYRGWLFSHDPFGDTAEDQVAQSLASVRAHYDQVDIETSGTVEHLLGRVAADHERFVTHRGRNPFSPEASKLLLPFFFKVWIWIQGFGFNAAYLIQALGVMPQESHASLGVSDEVSPGVISSSTDSQFTYVVMPMRL